MTPEPELFTIKVQDAPRNVPTRPAQPPRHLGPHGRRLWRRVVAEFVVVEAHAQEQLAVACEAADRAAEARAAIEADGAYIAGRFGVKAHPGLSVERDARIRELRALRELGLDLADDRPPSRWRGR